ncbi:MAG: HAMP domain-containing protein [Anaerolineales bacterium]|nr:HAMP domain-containing protein [Anaerolineales bacterium]
MSIRLKVILPYLILTLSIALIGVYIVTRLVTNSLSERLTNQLLEAGRAVSDAFNRQESAHVDEARTISFTVGLAEALQNSDRQAALALVQPIASGLNVQNVILVTADGKELLHLLMDEQGNLQPISQETGAGQSPIVVPYLKNRNASAPPSRAFGQNLVNKRYFYYTALPVGVDSEFVGVIVIGTAVDAILPSLKTAVLADIVLYAGNGQVIGTTLSADDASVNVIQALSISPQEYQTLISSSNIVQGDNEVALGSRQYGLARGPLQVGNDRIGVFAVGLPLNFVFQSATENRTNYTLLFFAEMVIVVVVGVIVARIITRPLSSLVNTSQAIAGGNLEQRTGIQSNDEIGELATTFDMMTNSLQERTRELQTKNELLEKMDRTKANFIQISAHELRTPLTLIVGYAQMLEYLSEGNEEALKLIKGIVEGSDRMKETVDNMLDVSRIDSNMLYVRKSEVQIAPVLQRVQRVFSADLKERKINLELKDLSKLPALQGDPEMLQKAFYQVIMNSIKYTPDGGLVTVSGQYKNGTEPPHLEIVVQDTGIGIDPKELPNIFNKFSQTGDVMLHSSGKTKFKGGGLGMGLVIARGIVEAHGGKIWAESRGHDEVNFPGSAFYISLPVEKEGKA